MRTYEERVYGPGRPVGEDSHAGEEGISSPNYAFQHTQMVHTPPPQPDFFITQPVRSHVTSQADEDDRSTIVADSRRGSPTWEVGRAL